MIDPRDVRSKADRLKEIIKLRKVPPNKADVDRWLELDVERRALQQQIEGLNAEKKKMAALGKTDPEAVEHAELRVVDDFAWQAGRIQLRGKRGEFL